MEPGLMYKLQQALKHYGYIITISTHQFYSPEQDRLIKCYTIKRGKTELIKSCSMIKIVKYLATLLQDVRNAGNISGLTKEEADKIVLGKGVNND